MNTEEIKKIALDTMTKPIDEIDLSMYSKEDQELINQAICSIEIRVDAMIEENFLEKRGAFNVWKEKEGKKWKQKTKKPQMRLKQIL